MTATLRRRPPVGGVQRSSLFWPVVVGTAAIAAIATAAPPPGWLSAVVVVAVIAVLGIPHGAVDHLAFETMEGRRDRETRRRFVRGYLVAMAGVGLVWLVAAPAALAIFLAVSVHHFGQSDLAYLRLPGRRQLVLQWSRGLFLVGLPLVAHVATISPVIERLGGGDPASWWWLADFRWWWCAMLVVQHAVAGAVVAVGRCDREIVGREVVTVVALAALFLSVHPLVAFAVYFGLWHSLSHLLVLADLLGAGPKPLRSLARLAVPMTVVSFAGLGAMSAGAVLAGRPDLLLPAVFVFVSMLTMPHMVVVERLWRRPSSNT